MAKVKSTKKTTKTASAKKVTATVEKNTTKATAVLRKGVLAYVGMYGAAYERAQFRFEQARKATDGLFETFVEKGEKIETQASEMFKGTQTKVTKTYEENAKKVRSMLPASANDRVEELEAEIAALNKKIVTVGKKVRPAVKAKTDKTVQDVKAKTNEAVEAVKSAAEKAA